MVRLLPRPHHHFHGLCLCLSLQLHLHLRLRLRLSRTLVIPKHLLSLLACGSPGLRKNTTRTEKRKRRNPNTIQTPTLLIFLLISCVNSSRLRWHVKRPRLVGLQCRWTEMFPKPQSRLLSMALRRLPPLLERPQAHSLTMPATTVQMELMVQMSEVLPLHHTKSHR